MKKFRPLNAGYILTYAVVALCIIQGVWIIVSMILRQNAQDSVGGMLDMVVADPRSHRRASTAITTCRRVVEISSTHMRIVRPAQIIPKPGQQRANFLFRQGASDNVLIRRKFELAQLAKYGYIEEFGLQSEDKSGAKTDSRFFPVHEVAFIMQDGRNCRMNAAVYKPAQLKEIFTLLRDATGIEPTGKLAEVLSAQ